MSTKQMLWHSAKFGVLGTIVLVAFAVLLRLCLGLEALAKPLSSEFASSCFYTMLALAIPYLSGWDTAKHSWQKNKKYSPMRETLMCFLGLTGLLMVVVGTLGLLHSPDLEMLVTVALFSIAAGCAGAIPYGFGYRKFAKVMYPRTYNVLINPS
ncbi:MAG: hypothetical protein K2W82_16715 [Candidatus Obscuribacterales bacterium]|nr:hypothetical protein [Candidatus Obscuribacterales bacterium]